MNPSLLSKLHISLAAAKWSSVGLLTFALFASTWAVAANQSGFVYRYSARYIASLEQRLRPMFIFTPGRHIFVGQILAAFMLLAAHIIINIDYWYIGLIPIAFGPVLYIDNLKKQRIEAVEMQLDSFILALANALKTTPSISAAFGSVVNVVSEPLRSEIDLALKEMKVGSTLDQALLHMSARVGSKQLDSALSSILIGRQVGGNLPKVLETTATTLREMHRLEGVVKSKTAEGKAQLAVIALLPFLMLVGLNFIFVGYFQPLVGNLTGYMIIAFCTGSWVTAIVLARKILAVDI